MKVKKYKTCRAKRGLEILFYTFQMNFTVLPFYTENKGHVLGINIEQTGNSGKLVHKSNRPMSKGTWK